MKVFLIGMPKSGTSTFTKAIRSAGYTAAHWTIPGNRRVGRMMYKRHFEGRDPFANLTEFEAITQADYLSFTESYWPQMDPVMLSAIQKHHPDCKFVLNFRDPDETAASIARWTDMQDRLIAMGAPGLPAWAAHNTDNIARWVAGHIDFCRAWFSGNPNFIEYRIDDPRAPIEIGAALGRDINWWGRVNANPA